MELDNGIATETPTPYSFGLVVPGGPLRTDFQQTEPNKFVLNFNTGNVPIHSVREVVLFIMPNFTIPFDHGVLCYWQITSPPVPPAQPSRTTGFELLGSLTPPTRPSAVFATGWGEHEQLVEMAAGTGGGVGFSVTVGISIEPRATVDNVAGTEERIQHGKLFVAQKIAADLFHFMQSFDTPGGDANRMVVPKNIFDRWFKRFSSRFQKDPNFFLKNDND